MYFTAIYHPPYSLKTKSTNRAFLDDFTDLVTDLLPKHPNNLLLGDFNLHVSNEDDIDSAIFLDTIEAMGLYQHVSFPTHKSGNTLDLIISEIQSRVTIMTTTPGPYITDHRAIISTLNIKKMQPRRQVKNIRKLHAITIDQWKEEFRPENVLLSTNLEDSIMSPSTEFRQMLNTLAPLKKCSVSLKPKKPWFNKDLAEHKAKMRHHEKKWLRHRLTSTWKAYTKVRNSYYGKLNHNKKTIIIQQITDCTNDSKKLYSLVSNLTTKLAPTPWLEHTDKEILAEEFADFFQNKILLIREKFDGIKEYTTITDDSVPRLQ